MENRFKLLSEADLESLSSKSESTNTKRSLRRKLREIEGCEIREIAGNRRKMRETGICGKREIAGCKKREIAGILWEFPQIGSTFFLWNVTYASLEL